MLAVVITSWWLRVRGRLFDTSWFQRACFVMAPLSFVAVLAGWTTTEVGRQPWTIYGLMRTADSVPPSLSGMEVLISLLGYIVVYLIIFPAGAMVMAKLVRKGPDSIESDSPIESGRPERPTRVQFQSEGEGS